MIKTVSEILVTLALASAALTSVAQANSQWLTRLEADCAATLMDKNVVKFGDVSKDESGWAEFDETIRGTYESLIHLTTSNRAVRELFPMDAAVSFLRDEEH
ncbi:MAG: hypothetical protein EOP04_18235, partial [Proteobacteria bacterium]